MATETLDPQQLLSNEFEPKRSYQFILSIDNIESFIVESANRPTTGFEEIPIPYLNNQRYIAGRVTPQPMEIRLRDPIAPSGAEMVMNWIRLCYESETGRSGYATMYKKDIDLKLVDGLGNVVEKWNIYGAFITSANFGELSYETGNAIAKISCTLRWDRAELAY